MTEWDLLEEGGAPTLTRDDISDVKATAVADPFMVQTADGWFMFFEVVVGDERGDEQGQIGLAASPDGKQWKYRQIVLKEPFHLSYPYVFAWGGEFWMIPETYQASSIRLYRATDFPTGWTLEKTLLTGDAFVDACPFFFGDRWWMFTSGGTPPMRADVLRLHHAPDLTGPWIEHSLSPIHERNVEVARPAGRPIVHEGRLFRFAQECRPHYGMLVRAFEITQLSEQSYRESLVGDGPVLKGSGSGWNAAGMHHIDAHPLGDGTWLACVDGWTWEDATP